MEPYLDDFAKSFAGNVRSLNKLERGQDFEEPGFASWDAFDAGDWDRSIALIPQKREAYSRQLAEAAERNILRRRLRVVEFPVTPYVQWEMFVLRLRVELGDLIRVLDARTVEDLERTDRIPELVILGDALVYEVLYDEGATIGARRCADPEVVADAVAGFDILYERGENFVEFFDREILPLAPPS
ncbi:DUF6879 family protein [Streptomyces sp. SID3343]|uniref:DUF6879 family protein n=1 Tax=Streptomyces sp. SID3343 TaxID=2690260 RepID=UPI0031F7A9E2